MATKQTITPQNSAQNSTSKILQSSKSPSERVTAADRNAVARRAYERFVARGGQHGHDMQDWLEAERELSSRN